MITTRRLTFLTFALLGFTAQVALAEAPVDPTEARRAMSDEALDARYAHLSQDIDRLSLEVRRDVEHRLHRIAYEKYRSLDALLAESVDLLLERKRREESLGERILIDRQIQALRDRVVEVRGMIDILRLYAQR